MANNKSILILRGTDTNPQEIGLLDGQPYYNKKNKLLYVGDSSREEVTPVGAANLAPGDGTNSIIQCNNYDDGKDTIYGSWQNKATGDDSIALGIGCLASNSRSVAIGNLSTASGNTAFAMGLFCSATAPASQSFGYSNKVNGAYSTSFGYSNTIQGLRSFVAGTSNNITGNDCSIFGKNNTKNSGDLSFIFGEKNTDNSKRGCFIGGNSNTAGSGVDFSIVWGELNQALHDQVVVFGKNNIGRALQSTTVGANNINYSCRGFVSGSDIVTEYGTATASSLLGMGLKAVGGGIPGQLICGKYNSPDKESIFQVGVGTSDGDRKNIFVVKENSIYFIHPSVVTIEDSGLYCSRLAASVIECEYSPINDTDVIRKKDLHITCTGYGIYNFSIAATSVFVEENEISISDITETSISLECTGEAAEIFKNCSFYNYSLDANESWDYAVTERLSILPIDTSVKIYVPVLYITTSTGSKIEISNSLIASLYLDYLPKEISEIRYTTELVVINVTNDIEISSSGLSYEYHFDAYINMYDDVMDVLCKSYVVGGDPTYSPTVDIKMK